MTDILATIVMACFVVSACVSIWHGWKYEHVGRWSIFFLILTGGFLFSLTCADRIALYDFRELRSMLEALPGEPFTGFTSSFWVVWLVGIGYIVRFIAFLELDERFKIVSKDVGELAAYTTFTVLVVELAVRMYEWHSAFYILIVLGVGLYFTPLVGYVQWTAWRAPRIMARVGKLLFHNLGAELAILLKKVTDVRRRMVRKSDSYGEKLDATIERIRPHGSSATYKELGEADAKRGQEDAARLRRRRR